VNADRERDSMGRERKRKKVKGESAKKREKLEER
jgi:hypothetical protein